MLPNRQAGKQAGTGVPCCHAGWMPDFEGYADVNDLRMYYEIHGEGPALLLLTAILDPPSETIPFFANSFQVIAPDQMGHGRTADVESREFDFHEMAEETVELLRQLEIDRTLVFGFSDGGVIGLDMAIHHPDLVSRLVVSSALFHPDGYRMETLSFFHAAQPDDWPDVFREPYDRLSPDGSSHWPVVIERFKTLMFSQPDFTPTQLASIQAPTLVVAGDHDSIRIEHSVALFRAIPNSRLCVVPGAGHGPLPKGPISAFLLESEPDGEA
jgi:pimeloyl-ACP methyl ester carboxylesterase